MLRRRRTQFHMGWETSATHSDDAGIFDLFDNLFCGKVGMMLQTLYLIRAVDALFPFVALDINNDTRFPVSGSIYGGIDLEYRS